MALNKLIFLFMLFLSFPAVAQEKFLNICQNPLPHQVAIVNDIKWLKYFFKTDDCLEVGARLSKLTSFNEFMVPPFRQFLMPFNWSKDFGYLTGITEKMTLELMPWSKLGFIPDDTNVFRHPELYSEFENLKVLDLSKSLNFVIKDLCHINDLLPHVKTVVVGETDLYMLGKNCPDETKIPWIIATQSSGKNLTKLHSRVIGFMNFVGSIRDLIQFRYLRYLGISNTTSDNDMRYLSKNINLTHLSMNIRTEVKNVAEIRELRNLRFLSLSCIEDLQFRDEQIWSILPCEKSFLTDISFLSELPWLQDLTLIANHLEDVSVVAKIKRLKTLNLSYNNISKIPDLSHLEHLEKVDFSNNPVNP